MYSADDVPRAKLVHMTEFVRPYFECAAKKLHDTPGITKAKLPRELIVKRMLLELTNELEPDIEPRMLMMLLQTGWLKRFVEAAIEALIKNVEERNERSGQE